MTNIVADVKCRLCLKVLPEAHHCIPVKKTPEEKVWKDHEKEQPDTLGSFTPDRRPSLDTSKLPPITDNTMDLAGKLDEIYKDTQNHTGRCADVMIPVENLIKSNNYMREILPGVWVDVYDVIDAFQVTDGGMQHAIKKMLATGKRGHKDEAQDRKDIEATVKRSNEIFNRKLL